MTILELKKNLWERVDNVVRCGYIEDMENITHAKPKKNEYGNYIYRGVVIHSSSRYAGKFYSCRQQYAAGIQGLNTAKHFGTLKKVTQDIDADIDFGNCSVLRGKTWTSQAIARLEDK